MEHGIIANINKNRQSLFIICLAAVVFFAFSLKGSGAKIEDTPPSTIKIGLYKEGSGKTPEEYYAKFVAAIQSKSIERQIGKVEVDFYGNLDAICDDLKQGQINIAGEISPIEYVKNYSKCAFKPFLGIEYSNKSYYQSVFFAANDVERFGENFRDEIGHDNLHKIKSLLKDRLNRSVLAVQSTDSTSGYYYPRSYMIDEGIDHNRTHKFKGHGDIFLNVLRKKEDNRFVGGFLADWRYAIYKNDIAEKKGIYDDKFEYAMPFIIDKSDPIPNGVFVISKTLTDKASASEIHKIKRIWKTIRDIKLDGGPTITGWRHGVEKDLDLVEYHKNKVDYYYLYKSKHQVYLAIFIAILVLVMCAVFALYLKSIGKDNG